MIKRVKITGRAQRQLRRVPQMIRQRLDRWVEAVELYGLERTRKRPGNHDEPLRGQRQGQRSVRLNRRWRAIYEIKHDGQAELVSVEEVTPHVY
jgi:proteic killer suppression protein